MDPRELIARRIDQQLRQHLGEGIDAQRALSDARYVRDVLFVCDAMTGTELPQLAREFRSRVLPRGGHHAGPDHWANARQGIGVPREPLRARPH